MKTRKAIKSHSTDTSNNSWSKSENEKRLRADESASYYRKAYAWVDPDKDPAKKSSYKFLHHEIDSDGNIGPANMKACQSIIGALNGARGGAKIPEEDRKGVWNHAARHLRDGELEPAELKSIEDIVFQKRSRPEKRFVCSPEIRINRESDDSPVIEGYAAVFNEWTSIGGFFDERIARGAFKKTINESDIRALMNHDPNYILGRNKADPSTLALKEDRKGLFTVINPPGTQWANDLLVSMDRGDINQMSFAFDVIKESWDNEENKRTIQEVKLYDVSVVTYPAYPTTSAYLRSMLFIPESETKILDSLTGVLFKASRGIKLSDNDCCLLRDAIDLYQSYLPVETEPASDHSTSGNKPSDEAHLLSDWIQMQAKIAEYRYKYLIQ